MEEESNKILTVAEVLAMDGWSGDRTVSVHGILRVTSLFAYLVTNESDDRGILVIESKLMDKLLACMPACGGSMVIFSGRGSVDGLLRSGTALPMFPTSIHSVASATYQHDDWEPARLEFGNRRRS